MLSKNKRRLAKTSDIGHRKAILVCDDKLAYGMKCGCVLCRRAWGFSGNVYRRKAARIEKRGKVKRIKVPWKMGL